MRPLLISEAEAKILLEWAEKADMAEEKDCNGQWGNYYLSNEEYELVKRIRQVFPTAYPDMCVMRELLRNSNLTK